MNYNQNSYDRNNQNNYNGYDQNNYNGYNQNNYNGYNQIDYRNNYNDNNQNDNNRNSQYRTQQMSYLRVLHASPNAPSVDIFANGSMIVTDLAYKELSPYLPVPSGNYNIQVYPSGEMTNPVIDTNVSIPPNSVFNVAAIGRLPDISLFPIQEPNNAPDSDEACVRFIHLSPNAPAVDIKLPDGTNVFENVNYQDITNYVCVPAETYSFNVTPAGTDNVVLSVPDIELDSDVFYTIYAVGLVGESPALEALLFSEPR